MKTKLHFLTICCLVAFASMAQAEQPQTNEQAQNNQQDRITDVDQERIGELEDTLSYDLDDEEKLEALVDLEVKGIHDKEAKKNVDLYLAQISNEYADGSERHQYLVQTTVDKALRALGYYNSQYQFVQLPRSGKKPLLVLNVELDKETVKIDETDIVLQGEAKNDEDFMALIKKAPKQGSRLNHKIYENFKGNIESNAFSKGYFDGHWLYHRLEVYPTDHKADWRLGYDSGIRYRYGQINFVDSQIKEEYLRNILKINSGEHYFADDLSNLTQDYLSSNWFSSVMVEPHLNEQDKTVDLNVLFQPKKKNEVEIGIGYETEVGPRLQFNWKKPWRNKRGHSIDTRTYISAPEQRFEFGYNIPLKKDPLHYYYQISGTVENEDQKDTKSTAASFSLQRFWTRTTGWSFSAGVRARYDSFTQANDKFKTLLVYPTASLNRTRTDGKPYPLWGDSQKLTVNWGSKIFGSDVNFYSYKASTSFVRTYAGNHRFYLRAELGYLKANQFERIPPALRFFAGGDMSVRGFGYKDISPRDPANGKRVGGSHLATGTLEYQYQVYPNWWGAAFYDVGLAANKFETKQLHHGTGLGVRWASPIGAIKFDVGMPVKSPDNKRGFQIYIGLGSDI
ncbi:outer membrane protein assembly factor [Mannheimia varigena]|uniref:autotransporter assembly complex protein TamA n=1 Tax=Mannheimia varigena TaxID=85404 RepID=UPI000DBF05DC|nr:autotransporter assembly complex family protein [Mannheimia varigena]AWW34853.1 outer membrane protein assembly factor [Mannheimia varigena]